MIKILKDPLVYFLLHVLNLHRPLDPDQQSELQDYFNNIQRYLELVLDEHSSRQGIQK